MSVQNQVPYNSYTANGVTTVFAFQFLLIATGDLIVEVNGVVQTSGFTIAGLGVSAGGSVTFAVAPANGSKVLLKRVLTLERMTDYQDSGDWLAETLNRDFDRLWQALQQHQQDTKRSLKLPYDTATDQVLIEGATQRANLLVGFDASGNMTLKIPASLSLQTVSAFAATLLDDVDAASARATLGLSAGADIASGPTLDLSTATGNLVRITGTTTTTAVTLNNGQHITCYAVGAWPLTYHATNMPLPGSANFTCAAGDMVVFSKDSSGEIHVEIIRRDGTSVGSVNPFSFVDAAGDLIVGTGNDTVGRLAKGAALQQLRVNSAGSALEWAPAAVFGTKVKSFPARQQADFTYQHMMIRTMDDTLLGWGRTGALALGINETADTTAMPRKPVFNIAIPAGVTVKDVVIANGSAWVLLSNGWVYSAGQNQSGQLGHGDTSARSVFTRIEFFVTNSITVDKIFAAGSRNAVNFAGAYFLNAAGNVWACGYNFAGQLGVGDTTNKPTPTAISGVISGVASVIIGASNQASVFLLKTDGTLYACGYNGQGSLGLGHTTNVNTFTQVPAMSGVAEVWCTSCDNPSIAAHTVLRLTNGTVYACGWNGHGQLGVGDTTNRNGFTQISSLSNIVSVGCSGGYYGYSWAVSSTGRLYIWGYNGQGVVSDGTVVNRTTPFDVVGWFGNTLQDPPFVGKISKVVAHYSAQAQQHLVVLDTDGMLWFTGLDYGFYCADSAIQRNRFTGFLPFTLESSTEKITDLFCHGTDANYRHFFLSNENRLYAIGDNANGVCQAGYTATPAIVKSMQRVPI